VLAAAFILAGSLTVPAMAHAAADLPGALHPLAAQTSDEAIRSDLAAIDGWHAKVDTLPGSPKDLWRAAAARAWLTVARAEYLDDDRTGFPQAAFARAVALIGEIEAGKSPVTRLTVPAAAPPAGTVKVADSLYAVLGSLKHHPYFLCAAEELAN